MFPASFKKFYAVIGMSFLLGLGAMAFLRPGVSATGFVTASGEPMAFAWPVFFFGLFVGTCVVGLLFGMLHHERNRL